MAIDQHGVGIFKTPAYTSESSDRSRSASKKLSGFGKLRTAKSSASVDSTKSKSLHVPQELIPYLHRIRTKDYVEYMDEKFGSQTGGCNCLHHIASRIINLVSFEYFMGLVIVLNLIVMIIETDLGAEENADIDHNLHWTAIFGWVVLGIFVIELSIRLMALRCFFWHDTWNCFDFAIVVIDSVFSLAGLIGGTSFPVSILRIFRLAKLARVFKVLRVFTELRLLLAGLLSSISAIFWGTLLLFFCILVWSLVAVLFIHPLNRNIDYESCERCSRAYSSVMQSTLTFWQQIVTGDSWGMASIPVIEKHPSTAVFFISVYLSVGMAVTNLILGVVVNVAQQAQDSLQLEDQTDRALEKLDKHTHLIELCKQMDADSSGSLSQEEVYAAFRREGEFRDSILALEISAEDFDIVWAIIDPDQKGHVSYKELVSSLSTMKISDTQFMLAYIKYYITMLRKSLLDTISAQHAETMQLEQKEEEILDKIEQKEDHIIRDDKVLLQKANTTLQFLARGASGGMETQNAEALDKRGKSPCNFSNIDPGAPLDSRRTSVSDLPSGVLQKDTSGLTRDAANLVEDLASRHDRTDTWLERICEDIASLRIELRDLLADTNVKPGPLLPPIPALDRDKRKVQSSSEMLVLPAVPKKPSSARSFSACCNALDRQEPRVLQIQAQDVSDLEPQSATQVVHGAKRASS